jgi:hypothetical protein
MDIFSLCMARYICPSPKRLYVVMGAFTMPWRTFNMYRYMYTITMSRETEDVFIMS